MKITGLITRVSSQISPPPSDGAMRMLLRLDGLRQDEVGWLATFFGKPDVHGNRISVPVTEELASRLKVGNQYLFEMVEKGAA